MIKSLSEAYEILQKARKKPFGHKEFTRKTKSGKVSVVQAKGIKPSKPDASKADPNQVKILVELVKTGSLAKERAKGFVERIEEDLKGWGMNPDEPANVAQIGEYMAVENLGQKVNPKRRGVDPALYEAAFEEFEAWDRCVQTASSLLDKMGIPKTNWNVLAMTQHKKSMKMY